MPVSTTRRYPVRKRGLPELPRRAVIAGLVLAAVQLEGGEGERREAFVGFARSYWFESGLEHGNPPTNTRFRVNAPESVLHPSFGKRPEARGNGMMLIRIDEDLTRVTGAELYLELWGGHPGTGAKRVTVNGRSTYRLPPNGTAEHHCTHLYPTVRLKRTDLVDGHNALQFACDRGSAFWGHFIVDNACLRILLPPDDGHLEEIGLGDFEATVSAARRRETPEVFRLALGVNARQAARVTAVEFHGHYDGYDENGNGRSLDWHGFTKERQPVAILGTAREAPFEIDWDVSMLPAQRDMAVRARVRLRDAPHLVYETPVLRGLDTPPRDGVRVRRVLSGDLPAPFWSRAGELQTCTLRLAQNPGAIERAELHVVVWDGGRGKVEAPFQLNGQALGVVGEGRHDVLYRRLEVHPALLRRGANRIELLSDTEHHGIEVLLPGPALIVRSREEPNDG